MRLETGEVMEAVYVVSPGPYGGSFNGHSLYLAAWGQDASLIDKDFPELPCSSR